MPVSLPTGNHGRRPDWPVQPPTLVGCAEGLFELYTAPVYTLARRLLGREGDAEEVALAVLVQAARQLRLGGAVPGPELSARLLRVTVAAARAARRPPVPAPEPPRRPTASPPRPGQRMEELIAELPPALRDPFVLADVEGLPIDEAADLLGLSAAVGRRQLHQARLQLARGLAG
jgi:DNA-directed RNA polymerase specialized sigma24 family protein